MPQRPSLAVNSKTGPSSRAEKKCIYMRSRALGPAPRGLHAPLRVARISAASVSYVSDPFALGPTLALTASGSGSGSGSGSCSRSAATPHTATVMLTARVYNQRFSARSSSPHSCASGGLAAGSRPGCWRCVPASSPAPAAAALRRLRCPPARFWERTLAACDRQPSTQRSCASSGRTWPSIAGGSATSRLSTRPTGRGGCTRRVALSHTRALHFSLSPLPSTAWMPCLCGGRHPECL
mgnify:CR=1 FL=1